MDLIKLSKAELLVKCEEHGLKGYKSKTKSDLIKLIENNSNNSVSNNASNSNSNSNTNTNTNTNSNTKINIEFIIEGENEYENKGENKGYLTMIDLFAGTGAFSYAFHKTNKVYTIFANDMLDSSEAIYNLNNDVKLTKKDLNEIDNTTIPKANILTGGFPCQPFSIAGKQKGFDDERSNVFWKIISILKSHSPEIVILENVKNLQSHDNGDTFKVIIDSLTNLGYYIKYSILNTCKITYVPQNRERIYIVCFKNKELCDKFDFDFPEVEKQNITNFLEDNVDKKFYYSNSSVIYNELLENITKHVNTNTIYQYRRYYVRENKNNVCPTLTANMGGGGHNVPLILDDKGIRKLTPRECFNLQGFPNDYKLPELSLSKLYSLAGNAVSVPVVNLIANKIMSTI